jgi:cell wall-associated NlpC family hydrolase
MGGDSLTTGIDCSHFVWRVLKEAGLSVPYRDSSALASWTKRTTNPQPGDLVLYRGHVGIYAGNGMMVHHGKPGGAFFIKVYTQNLIGYGRIPS